MKLLHLDSSIMGEGSASRAISAAIVQRLQTEHAGLEIAYRDLAAEAFPHLTLDVFLNLETGKDVQQFLDADIVIIGVGFYNFSIPSQLKAWIDHIVVKGKTFIYSENGPVGLAQGKRVVVALARGNVYSGNSPYATFEHAETLLHSLFTFIGAEIEFIVAEGLGLGDDARRGAIGGALEQAQKVL